MGAAIGPSRAVPRIIASHRTPGNETDEPRPVFSPDASAARLNPDACWRGLTRLGESGIALPLLLVVAGGIAWSARRPTAAFLLLLPTALAVLLVTASKIAFLGFGWGIASLDFTGLSGHAMFAAAIYPMLAATFAPAPSTRYAPAMVLAAAVAVVVAISRLVTGAHSASEVLGGFAVGTVAAAVSIQSLRRIRTPGLALVWLAPAFAWLLFTLPAAPLVASHDWVSQLATTLAGRDRPFVRADLHR